MIIRVKVKDSKTNKEKRFESWIDEDLNEEIVLHLLFTLLKFLGYDEVYIKIEER